MVIEWVVVEGLVLSIGLVDSGSAGRPFYARKSFIVPVIIVLLLIIGLVVYFVFVKPMETYPWLFRGAYAVYKGSTIHPITNKTVEVLMNVTVVDLNKTHAALEVYVKIISGNYTNETRGVQWIRTSGNIVLPARIASALFGPKTEKIEVPGLGVRECYIYKYRFEENATMTSYIDKDVLWPVMFDLEYTIKGHPVKVTLVIVESNIPGLMKK